VISKSTPTVPPQDQVKSGDPEGMLPCPALPCPCLSIPVHAPPAQSAAISEEELHLDMPLCAWPALSPNCRGRGAVVGPVQTGDQSSHAVVPSPPAQLRKGGEAHSSSSSSGEPCPDSSHQPIVDSPLPWPQQPRLAGLRSTECFNFTKPPRLRLGPVDRSMHFVFPGLALGPS